MTDITEQARPATVLDDDARRVGRIYAEALYGAAEKQGQAAEVLDELETLVGEVFNRVPHLEEFLASAAVGRERKAEVLRQTFQGRASDVLTRFLFVLNNHDRLGVLRAVAQTYREMHDRKTGRVRVRVESVVPLSDDQQERLKKKLREALQREPILEPRIDPELLGGLVVRVEDWVYDASVRSRLDNIQKELIERSSHEIQSGRNRFSADV
jgi:F-type H+-transporting ATPase subunit delta